jgi:hypothetical protein
MFSRMDLSEYHPVVLGHIYQTKVLKQLQTECSCVVFSFVEMFWFSVESFRVLAITSLSAHTVGLVGIMYILSEVGFIHFWEKGALHDSDVMSTLTWAWPTDLVKTSYEKQFSHLEG